MTQVALLPGPEETLSSFRGKISLFIRERIPLSMLGSNLRSNRSIRLIFST